jgi:subtilase family serine protease
VAIVDAYGYASAESDLAKYREKYGLSACTTANGCFRKVNQKGEEKNYPPESGELEKKWSIETALDMDMVSAACPQCHVLLVEATTQNPADTAASVEEAAALKAVAIGNSYGYPENSERWCPEKKGCKEYLAAYNQPSTAVTVSAGDEGYNNGVGAPSWPATSPNVIAVGGTSLKKAENSRGWSETVWKESGSGCSLYESKPTWQHDTGCTKRTDNDVAAVADNNTPVSIYNTGWFKGWVTAGGTSAAAPLVAGIEGQARECQFFCGAPG